MYPDDPVLLFMWLADVDCVLGDAASQEDFHHFAVILLSVQFSTVSVRTEKENIGIPIRRGLNAFNHFISWGILNRKVTPWSKPLGIQRTTTF